MPQLVRLLFLACIVLLLPHWVQASHALGGQLTYEALGNNRYRVTARYFRDCSGIAAENGLTLVCRVGSPTTSCSTNDPRNFTATLLRGTLTPGSPYCPNVLGGPSQCTVSGLPNYETALYTAEITLPPAPEWTLSVDISARPSLANILGNNMLRFEATLRNQLTLNGQVRTLDNTSPQYQSQDVPVPFVCWQQRSTISFSATEPDGDSLVYSLARPLDGCNLPSSYLPQPQAGATIGLGAAPSCHLQVSNSASGSYSVNFPIASYTLSGSCPTRTGTPYFVFNSQQASFTFAPMQYLPGPSSDGLNKYAIVGKVTEYRRLNGRYYEIGSVRRDMLVVVMDCGSNSVPNMPTVRSLAGGSGSGVLAADSTTVEAQVNALQELNLLFSDPNAGDNLTVTFAEPTDRTYADLYAAGTFERPFAVQANGTPTPLGKLRLLPGASTAGHVYYIPVRIEDDACPVRAVQNLVLVVRVASRTVTSAATGQGRVLLGAYPNPFTDRVTLSFPAGKQAQAIVIYDPMGREVDRLPAPAGQGSSTTTWQPAATMPAGVYLARPLGGQQAVRLLRTSQ